MGRAVRAGLLGSLILMVFIGCVSSGPSNAVIEDEFRHLWHIAHDGGNGWGWQLEKIEIGGISVDKNAGTAKVSIKFAYHLRRDVASRTKTGDFLFRRFGDKWEMDSRDGSPSSNRYQIVP